MFPSNEKPKLDEGMEVERDERTDERFLQKRTIKNPPQTEKAIATLQLSIRDTKKATLQRLVSVLICIFKMRGAIGKNVSFKGFSTSFY